LWIVVATALSSVACGGRPLRGAALNAYLEDGCRHAEMGAVREAFEHELLEHVRLEVRLRAVSSAEIIQRTGTQLYSDDVVLVAFDVLNHGQPCCSQLTEVTLASGGRDWRTLRGGELWQHAGLEPPVAGGVTVSYASLKGLFADVFIALLTVGQVDMRFRGKGTTTIAPSRKGTGTRAQRTALGLIGASLTELPDQGYAGRMDHYVALLVPPDPPPAASVLQELVVRVTLELGERNDEDDSRCSYVVERRVVIPAGNEPTGERLQRVLDGEPAVVIGSLAP
ncbi:MAG: hypothetical protein R3B72_52390, partial [Polyangiaceae bacterium]